MTKTTDSRLQQQHQQHHFCAAFAEIAADFADCHAAAAAADDDDDDTKLHL